MTTTKINVYDMVGKQILEIMSRGIIPWQQPWVGTDAYMNYNTGKPYSLVNQLLLFSQQQGIVKETGADPADFTGKYLTFKQITARGGKVKKGATACKVIFWNIFNKNSKTGKALKTAEEIQAARDNGTLETIPTLRYYNVFDLCQTDGISYEKVNHGFRYDRTADELINDYTTANNIEVISNPETIRACYSPTRDRIEIPRVERFACLEEYYGTLFHEAVHSTGKDTRLNRLHKTAAFGNEEYSKEELVAEIGSAALLNMVGLSTEQTTENSAAYIQSWSKFIRENTRAFVSACGQADKAVEFIKNFS